MDPKFLEGPMMVLKADSQVSLKVVANEQYKNTLEKEALKIEKKFFDPQILNAYSYAKNNPISYIDPFGLEPTSIWDLVDDAYDAGNAWINYADALINTAIEEVGAVIDQMGETNGNLMEVDTNYIVDQTAEAYESQQSAGTEAWENTFEWINNIYNYATGQDPEDYSIETGEFTPRDEE